MLSCYDPGKWYIQKVMTEEKLFKFKLLLDENYTWPCSYSMKVIVKASQVNEVIAHLHDHEISHKPSKKGNYISITGCKSYHSSDEVLETYQKVSTIEGVISL